MDRLISMQQGWWRLLALLCVTLMLAACGSDDSATTTRTPVISTQPADISVVAGSAATFSVTASGDSPVYQWQRSTDDGASWADIAAATASSYSQSNVSLGDSGHLFRVLVSAAGATVASSSARLTVTTTVVAPAITVQPADQTVVAPATATFSVTATGTDLQYQWEYSFDGGAHWYDSYPYSGITTLASYTTPASSVSVSGVKLRVKVSNSAGSVTSNAVTLTVTAAPSSNAAPAFTTQPVSQSVVVGSTATFSAVVSGIPTPYLRWKRSTDGGVTWGEVALNTSADYTTPPAELVENGTKFRLDASNSEGSVSSDVVTLMVTPAPSAPVFLTPPYDASVSVGNSAHFSVAASGVPTPVYQWQVSTDNGANWSNIVGATLDSYDTPAAVIGDNGKQFRAVASNSEGSVHSNAATLTVSGNSGWQSDQQVGSFYTNYSFMPEVASNANGQVAVVWSTSAYGAQPKLYIRRYDPANGWGPDESLLMPLYGSGYRGSLGVGMDNQGTVTAVWDAGDVGYGAGYGLNRVWAVRHTLASGWGAPAMQPLPDHNSNAAGNGWRTGGLSAVAVNPAGGATVLWVQDKCVQGCVPGARLVTATFGAGGWGEPNMLYEQNLESGISYSPADIWAVTGPDGQAVAIWRRWAYNTANYVNSYSRWSIHFTAGTAGGGTIRGPIADEPILAGASPIETSLAVDGQGNAVVAWLENEYIDFLNIYRVRFSRYDNAAGSWDSPQLLNGGCHYVTHPSVAVAANGNAVVAASNDCDGLHVMAVPWTVSGGWGQQELAFDSAAQIPPYPGSVMTSDGVPMIIASVTTDGSLQSSRRVAGQWGGLEEASGASRGSRAKLVPLPGGDVLAIWYGTDGFHRSNVYKAAP